MIEEMLEFNAELYEVSKEYAKQRQVAIKNELSFQMVLASRLQQIKTNLRSNAGVEMCTLTLLGGCEPEVAEYYTNWKTARAQYEGLDKIIDAVKEKINVKKAILKADH